MERKPDEDKSAVALRVTDAAGKTPTSLVKGTDYRLELHAQKGRPLVFAVRLM